MIRKLSTCITDDRNPYRNLALEKYLTLHVEQGECILFLWQNQRTVVIGRNQNCWKECRISRLEADGGFLARRLSGGGAVFHDLGNLNFTFCVCEEDYDVDRQLEVIVQAVRKLGVDARKTGRNDVTVDGRKFSGNAFYRSGGHCFHHGTLLVNADTAAMAGYLSVSPDKLKARGVDSVRSRVINLCEQNPAITVGLLRERMLQAFEQVYGMRAEPFPEVRYDPEELRAYEAEFSSWEWKYGRSLPFRYRMYRRFPWGDLELRFRVDGGRVQEVQVFSDSMDHRLAQRLEEVWRDCPYEAGALAQALEDAGDTRKTGSALAVPEAVLPQGATPRKTDSALPAPETVHPWEEAPRFGRDVCEDIAGMLREEI